MKAILLRTYVALLAAARAAVRPTIAPPVAAAYMTWPATSTACASWAACAGWSRTTCGALRPGVDERRPLDTPAPHLYLANRDAAGSRSS
jgi:hypothetical protein